ncbi:glycoside hydrolase superfamily [Tribonema minus]|uniref:Glycoside hydrolase superfamily n=1 Tax=Tribonema minus TaxID=303371 RepID=A0A836CIY0_9STRA|nr:glycoside hydrolase superfamily [Tribonema minus]
MTAGTTVTAVANQWNLISGAVYADSTGKITLQLVNLPSDADVWLDDFMIQDCSMDRFSVTVNLGAPAKRNSSVKETATLKANIIMQKHAFPLGAAMYYDCMNNPKCTSFFKKHFNWGVTEVGSKWGDEYPERNRFKDWGMEISAAITGTGAKYRAHSTYWEVNKRVQQWVKDAPLDGSSESLQAALWWRVNDYVSRYKGKAQNWDVNNEMLHGQFFANKLPCKGGAKPCICDYAAACPPGMGADRYIDVRSWMFKAMRYLLGPTAKLHTNDYCNMNYCTSSSALSNLVKQSLLYPELTGMGVQSHLSNAKSVCGFNLMARFDHATAALNGRPADGSLSPHDIFKLKKKMWVTEFDVQEIVNLKKQMWVTEFDVQESDHNLRGQGYEMMYRAAYASAGVEGVMAWGWSQPSQWRPDIAMVDNDFTTNWDPARRILGPTGLFHAEWNSTYYGKALETGRASPNKTPAKTQTQESHIQFSAFPGEYRLEVGGCTTQFTVPVGMGPLAVDARAWKCRRGKRALAAPRRVGGAFAACHEAPKGHPVLSEALPPTTWDTMTPSKCLLRCKAASKPYAALTNGATCTCGGAPVTDETAAAHCSERCRGDAAHACGAADAASVWTVALSST